MLSYESAVQHKIQIENVSHYKINYNNSAAMKAIIHRLNKLNKSLLRLFFFHREQSSKLLQKYPSQDCLWPKTHPSWDKTLKIKNGTISS